MQIDNITFGATKINRIPYIQKAAGKKLTLNDVNLSGYTAFIGGKVYTPEGKFAERDLLFDGKKIVAIDDFDEDSVKQKINYVISKNKRFTGSILDEHIHLSFPDSSEEEIRMRLKRLAQNGTGAVIATTLPGNAEQVRRQIQILNNIIKHPDEEAAKIYGIHLEGPFLNPEKRGIHSEKDLMKPTIENYESFSPENIKIVTLAPELDEGFKLTKYLQDKGIIVSAGHSIATAKQIIDSGIKQVTHIFNAMSQLHHRNPTIANEGLLNPQITAELLADEASVSSEFMNMLFRLKPKDKIVLISDALPTAGTKEDFIMSGKPIHVDKDGIPKDDNGTLAGNMKFLPEMAKIFIKDTIMTFTDFIKYACVNPARNLGVLSDFEIKKDSTPNFSVWDNKTKTIEKTFIA